MADDPTKNEPVTPEADPPAPKEPEDANAPAPKEPEGGSAPAPGEPEDGEVRDSHGQPGINKERHDREVAELQAKIEALEARAAEAAEQKAKRDEYEKEVSGLKAELADSRVTHSLEMAGCLNVKAAKALLEDYGGDVAKLKAGCPYLFGEDKPNGTTGAKPAGAPRASAEDDAKLDRAFGLKE